MDERMIVYPHAIQLLCVGILFRRPRGDKSGTKEGWFDAFLTLRIRNVSIGSGRRLPRERGAWRLSTYVGEPAEIWSP